MHAAASIEIRQHHRHRGRLHVEPHPAMTDLTVVSFSDGDGTDFELTLNPSELSRFVQQLGDQLTVVTAFRENADQARSAVSA